MPAATTSAPPTSVDRARSLLEDRPGEEHAGDGLEEREHTRGLRGDPAQEHRVDERRRSGEDDPEGEDGAPLPRAFRQHALGQQEHRARRRRAPTRQSQNATVSGGIAALRSRFESSTSTAYVAAEPSPAATAASDTAPSSPPSSAIATIPSAPTSAGAEHDAARPLAEHEGRARRAMRSGAA